MKQIAFILFLLTLASACSSTKTESSDKGKYSLDTTTLAAGSAFYQCPMHPEVISKDPGTCPKCGMALEKVVKH